MMMKPQAQWHSSLTEERIVEAYERELVTLDNPGFCLDCGNEQGGCEPDARRYRCEACGAHQVYGAQELLLALWPWDNKWTTPQGSSGPSRATLGDHAEGKSTL